MRHIVSKDIADGIRICKYLIGLFPSLQSNSAIKKAVKSGIITVNGDTVGTGHYVKPEENIVYEPVVKIIDIGVDIEVVYEDDYFAIVNKRAGLLSSGNSKTTLANGLSSFLERSSQEDRLACPLLVHRLDRATSGLMIAAKTASVRIKLGTMLSESSIEKSYTCICEGFFDKNITKIESPIDGKSALTIITDVQHLDTRDSTSVVSITLGTGRTHQIRKHFTDVGYPIVGDSVYNMDGLTFGRGLFLVAHRLQFNHPVTSDIVSASVELPRKFGKYVIGK